MQAAVKIIHTMVALNALQEMQRQEAAVKAHGRAAFQGEQEAKIRRRRAEEQRKLALYPLGNFIHTNKT